MQSSNIPSKIPLPFAYAAGSSYINSIPTASQIGIVNGRASLHDGFPPDTFTPISAGGVPPFGGDFNGILNEITSITQWQEAGGFFKFDSTFSTTVDGYPKGAILQAATLDGFWLSIIENNTNNPDTTSIGWVPFGFYGASQINVTSTTTTATNQQIAYPIINIAGTLTANSVVNFPNVVGLWTIINITSGSYTLTVKTASGTGVIIPQGQSVVVYGYENSIFGANTAQVSAFNGRTGAVSLNATDITNALGFPVSGLGYNGTVWGNITPTSGTAYQNTKSYPVSVVCSAQTVNGTAYVIGSIGSTSTSLYENGRNEANSGGGGTAIVSFSMIVPPGSWWKFDYNSSFFNCQILS